VKIGIQTWGSNGDIRPLLALAQGRQKAGHSVTLAVTSIDNKNYTDIICADLNIRYLQIPRHIDFDMQGFAQRTFRMRTPWSGLEHCWTKRYFHRRDCKTFSAR
jgi:UDP:flavonoid glycosyltransferase YjiC (YdhE family)